MISSWNDHYFGESKCFVGYNKFRYREYLVIKRAIFYGWEL